MRRCDILDIAGAGCHPHARRINRYYSEFRLKLSPQAHKNIFLISCLILAAGLITAAVLADRDRAAHLSYYEIYTAADEQFKEKNFTEPYETYKWLATIYTDAYVLELKMAVCAMNMGLWDEAVEHSRRTIELYPLLAKDGDFMDSFAYSLRQLGDDEAAERVEDYYYNFAMKQDGV